MADPMNVTEADPLTIGMIVLMTPAAASSWSLMVGEPTA